MRLDRLLTEIQLGGDFAVGSAVDDQSHDLELALGQRFDVSPVSLPRSRAPMDVVAKPSKLTLGSVAVADCAAPLQLGGDGLERPAGCRPEYRARIDAGVWLDRRRHLVFANRRHLLRLCES
jgi:hypothetical protein